MSGLCACAMCEACRREGPARSGAGKAAAGGVPMIGQAAQAALVVIAAALAALVVIAVAMIAWRLGVFEDDLARTRRLAEGGDRTAQSNLGHRYDEGKGVPKDYAEAVRWYRKAADQGEPTAQNNLAVRT